MGFGAQSISNTAIAGRQRGLQSKSNDCVQGAHCRRRYRKVLVAASGRKSLFAALTFAWKCSARFFGIHGQRGLARPNRKLRSPVTAASVGFDRSPCRVFFSANGDLCNPPSRMNPALRTLYTPCCSSCIVRSFS